MRTKLYTINWILAFAFLALVGCSDDFVDVPSEDENSEDYFNTPEEYDLALVGAYDLLQATYLNVMLGEIASDNTLAGGESATDVPGIQEIDDMVHTPVNAQLRDIWSWMFAGVNRANYVLEFQDNIDFAGKNEIIAQARFLRAYYYFELVKWFGDVPLAIDSRIQFGDQFDIPRAPKSEVYALIEQDLMFAAANLPATQAEKGRITSGAAQALLGKAYLYQNKFGEAASAFEPVINGPYSLVEDYEFIFEPEGENNAESIFEVQYTDKEGAGFGCLQCSEGNVAVGFNGVRNISYPPNFEGGFDSGFSFNVPVQEVVDLFTEDDIRKDVAILDIEAHAAETGATYATGFEHTGYFNRKYIARRGDLNTGDANLTNPNNYRAIRLADVLLMAAEANFKKSAADEDKARAYLNLVRERAELDPVTLSGNALLEQIYEDRRLELVGEGHRFFDLVRTGRAAAAIDGFQTGKHELFPIPAIEIELAGNNWQQNPGY
ncbi:RagB/SusD family nutrient uptake outer membrane protein [Christiangramia sabulilitoris]|uniref:RagB/SusD family nutrient uptake outer membrane protein n=1 Tax=Christiangramia sabulilitoris TaxID=2583991 RepID=A0A550I968_9FLAO|nr:RagB/SusD family nutrient uptake outer membrane protein [Christiangramia sabulilitoris]TRO67520.1 RagB/SusD family nutrient uptake outer membrane protein [Christiangramia sabulilitoris]